MFHKHKEGALCGLCRTVTMLVGFIGIVLSVLAIVGVYRAHFLTTGLTFGTTNGSLAILSLAVSLLIMKTGLDACTKCDK